jgi:hypothetical protein
VRSRRRNWCPLADLSGRIRTCGQNKLNAHLFGEERVDVGFEDQWIDNSSMADRDPTLTVGKNGHRHGQRHASPRRLRHELRTLATSTRPTPECSTYHQKGSWPRRVELCLPTACEDCHVSRPPAIAALGEEAKDDYLLINPTIRNAKAIVRSTTRQR